MEVDQLEDEVRATFDALREERDRYKEALMKVAERVYAARDSGNYLYRPDLQAIVEAALAGPA